ncbi:semaphorin-5A-like isoform X2 [Mercenaria mercenaria]|uniref:semaphorin-5A-like isoform X2 n=1 Tax=Mercenaria mercenaria TaxID=6596 RepID=UPI00234E9D78|nr:semaphorin-5A-like isoform X2 [Mercenaria mercenaria]
MCKPRRSFLSFLILWWIFVLSHSSEPSQESFPREFDFRYTSYEELTEQASIFNHENLIGFTQLTLDKENDQLLVGARDSIFRLSLDNLDLLEYAEFRAEHQKSCIDKGQSESSCHNYIRVLLLHNYTKTDSTSEFDNAVFVCGTNAFSPICQWRPANNLSRIIEASSGVGKSPHDPGQNSTTIITTDGDIYGATNIGTGDRDPAIYRSNGPKSKELRTAQANSKWLNEPDFVSSYEIGDLVYFFFREVAVEYINCGKRIYSRVARLCKSDQGGIFENIWTTYFKSRLNCSLPGQYPFYYDEIQGTFLLEDGTEKYLYAVFNTPMNSIAGSAVCVYNIKALEKSFAGPFKYQESPRSAWERHEQPDNGQKPLTQCPEKKDQSKRSNDKHTMDESRYQMMDDAVQPESLFPFVHADNERWTHVVVDNVKGKQGQYKVVFVATADGKIRKLTTLLSPKSNETCLIEEIKIVPNGDHKPVKAMRISPEEMAIYISTQYNVIKVPVHRCSRFENSDLCLSANDPYCGWNEYTSECTPAPSGQPEVHFWSQSMTGCPFVPHPVNGGWSDWSGWELCSQVGGDATAGECLCRSRSCDNPKPYYGGQPCVGASVEVTNCTAHGQWTEWTSWSACSQTCGSMATRQRHRYCSNPPPRFGGRDCIGLDFEEDYCQGHPPCPLPPVKGNWKMWADWSECSANCNGGIQTRRRSCIEPPPPVDSIPCVGNTQEWRMCNTQICEMLNQMTPWTPWVATNHTKGGYFEERFRFMCQAKVPSQTMIQSKHIKTQARFCFDGGQCHDSGELSSGIDTHSPIDRVLRRYCKHRRRLFRGYCKCRTLGIFLVCQKCGYG